MSITRINRSGVVACKSRCAENGACGQSAPRRHSAGHDAIGHDSDGGWAESLNNMEVAADVAPAIDVLDRADPKPNKNRSANRSDR